MNVKALNDRTINLSFCQNDNMDGRKAVRMADVVGIYINGL